MTKPRSTRFEPKPFVNIKLGGERIRVEAFGWSKLNKAVDLLKPVFEAMATGVDALQTALSMPEVLTEIACMALRRDRAWLEEADISTDELHELLAVIYSLNEPELKKVKLMLAPRPTSAKSPPGNLSPLTRSLQNLSPLVL